MDRSQKPQRTSHGCPRSDLADLSTRRKGPQNFQILFAMKKQLGIEPGATRRIAMESSEQPSICRSRFFIMEDWKSSGSPSVTGLLRTQARTLAITAVQLSRLHISVDLSNASDKGVELCSSRKCTPKGPYTHCNPGTFKSSVRRGDGKRTPNVGSACKQRRFRFVLLRLSGPFHITWISGISLNAKIDPRLHISREQTVSLLPESLTKIAAH